jgi:predicted NUDIX family phosphoesterase
MSKMDKRIVVVSRDSLFREGEFTGYKQDGNYIETILREYRLMRRFEAEENPAWKQPIPYAVIMNNSGEIYYYVRGSKDYSEKRLAQKGSIGIGGHIDEDDLKSENFIEEALRREALEEVMLKPESIEHLGYINLEDTPVSRVHFGIVYLIRGDVKAHSSEISLGRMTSIQELEKLPMEEWSREALKAIKIKMLKENQQ